MSTAQGNFGLSTLPMNRHHDVPFASLLMLVIIEPTALLD
jgi:hypothetical protein